jgi:membrane dipeptidase
MTTAEPPIFDGHNDVLLRLWRAGPDAEGAFFAHGDTGHLDLPRARAGRFGGGFFAVFVPAEGSTSPMAGLVQTENGYAVPLPPPLSLNYSQQVARALTASLFRLEALSAGQLKIVRTAGELDDCLREGVLAAVLHFEGAEPIDPQLETLHGYYAAGLRSLGLVWSRPNAFATGVPFTFPSSPDTGPGLTDLGRELVRACNQLGILVDLSHLNEQGFWDVAALSDAPLVATHSCVHALCPHPRNLTDRQLDAIRESDGLVGVNFNVGFLRADGKPQAETSLTEIVRHVSYIAERSGVAHVALGSDFDGALMPDDLGDVSGLPRLAAALRAAGFDDDALRTIAHENWKRVLARTWQAG